jgi:hypothetical protein
LTDKKISQLTNLTGANLADNDEFAVVDTSATETKAITFGELKTALDTSTGFVRITGDTMTGPLDVQSTITSDGLTVDGITSINGNTPTLYLMEADTTDVNTRFRNSAGFFQIHTANDAQNSFAARIGIDHSTGDISFYEDTGTTPKFFWDASTERLGIGTSSPSETLEVNGNAEINGVLVTGNANTRANKFGVNGNSAVNPNVLDFYSDESSKNPRFSFGKLGAGVHSWGFQSLANSGTNATFSVDLSWNGNDNPVTGLSVQSTGNGICDVYIPNGKVGIGTSSPANTLHVNSGTSNTVALFESTDPISLAAYKDDTTTNLIGSGASGDNYVFYNASERLRIDSSGNVGIGKSSSIIEELEVKGTIKAETSANDSGLYLQHNGTVAAIASSYQSTGSYTPLAFYTSGSEKVRIDTSGNVGIGTPTPATPLEITTTNKLGATFTGNINGEGLTVTQTDYAAGNYISLVEAAYDNGGRANPNVRIGAMFNSSGSHLAFGTSNSFGSGITNTAMFIDPSGDVGINTVTPSATLHVNGNAIATTNTDTSNTGSVTLDFAANQNFVLTLTGNVTLANPSTEVVGQSGFIVFIQDGTGGRTVSLGTDYETAGGAGLTLSSAASATDIVPYVVAASGRILLGTPQLAFS